MVLCIYKIGIVRTAVVQCVNKVGRIGQRVRVGGLEDVDLVGLVVEREVTELGCAVDTLAGDESRFRPSP